MFSVKVETTYCYVEYHNINGIISTSKNISIINDDDDVFNIPKSEIICLIIRKEDTDEN